MLRSARFRGHETLRACAESGAALGMGATDAAAVRAVQGALTDLGYRPGPLDGELGPVTATAVVAFDLDEMAAGDRARASIGAGRRLARVEVSAPTMRRLDAYFAHEPVDPDAPDPTTDGLADLADEAIAAAATWVDEAVRDVTLFDPDDEQPDDPQWVALGNLLERQFHGPRAGLPRRRVLEDFALPTYLDAAQRLAVHRSARRIRTLTRDEYEASGRGDYVAVAEPLPGALVVTPAFRNALVPVDRVAAVLLRVLRAHPRLDVFALPGSPHERNLQGDEGLRNAMGYVAFAYGSRLGRPPSDLHPPARWPARTTEEDHASPART